MAEQCTNPDYQILLQPGTRHSIRISEMRIGMAAQRIGPIEVEMRKATIITDTGNQTRPFREHRVREARSLRYQQT